MKQVVIIGSYSKNLIIKVGKKYNPRTLRRMSQLYLFFENQKWLKNPGRSTEINSNEFD